VEEGGRSERGWALDSCLGVVGQQLVFGTPSAGLIFSPYRGRREEQTWLRHEREMPVVTISLPTSAFMRVAGVACRTASKPGGHDSGIENSHAKRRNCALSPLYSGINIRRGGNGGVASIRACETCSKRCRLWKTGGRYRRLGNRQRNIRIAPLSMACVCAFLDVESDKRTCWITAATERRGRTRVAAHRSMVKQALQQKSSAWPGAYGMSASRIPVCIVGLFGWKRVTAE